MAGDADPLTAERLRGAARAGLRAAVGGAGGVALPFNTIAVSDNQSQGTPGMRASLISREVIADSIELMVHAHDFDALVCVVGCDTGVFARYRACVAPASEGAVLRPPTRAAST